VMATSGRVGKTEVRARVSRTQNAGRDVSSKNRARRRRQSWPEVKQQTVTENP
jgi:hypothetical protein